MYSSALTHVLTLYRQQRYFDSHSVDVAAASRVDHVVISSTVAAVSFSLNARPKTNVQLVVPNASTGTFHGAYTLILPALTHRPARLDHSISGSTGEICGFDAF